LYGVMALLLVVLTPRTLHFGPVGILLHPALEWTGGFLIAEGLLFLLYVKVGKFRHRDKMLAMYTWRGDEQVLDVGCGRGLLLAGAAKRLTTGRATGVDIWSSVDMGGNSQEATQRNLEIEGIARRCSLFSGKAQAMSFPDASFDVVVSNLCLHNISDPAMRDKAVAEIARVLKPGGLALISDYRHTGDYAEQLRAQGLEVERRWGNVITTFPPLRIVIARKPLSA
jgi:ubiquinone/menaquinone biosynthesis C-methylase UbiE